MKPLVIIAGPTASGKTSLSIELCKKINGAVISADSMQVYKGMDIGSAKVTKDEMENIPHYGIDILDPSSDYNVNIFQSMAKNAIEEIYKNNQIPVIVGGTGFYIQSVLYDIEFKDTDKNQSYRDELENIAKEKGPEYLHSMLKDIDFDSYNKIHFNNVKRVIRALEYYKETGEAISKHNEEESQKSSPYNFAFFVINDNRDILYERINKRVDIMFDNDLVSEVKKLMNQGITRDNVSMQGIGYKEVYDYLLDKYSLEESKEIIKQETRRFAKRQITWFKREKDAIWVDRSILNDDAHMLSFMLEKLKEKEII